MPGPELSTYEKNMGFKGQHADKLHITYKKEGDGFQYDCISDNGYNFIFYFRNLPAPKNWLEKRYSPLHGRCMALFDYSMDDYYQVQFENLYMSAKFSLGLFNHPKKVMIEGVSRTSRLGVPTKILQKEVTTK